MRLLRHLLPVAIVMAGSPALCGAGDQQSFALRVVDDSTGRGVPLVELETTNQLRFVTDSHGLVAINEPDLMGQNVHFTVRSHGYQFPEDGFGFRGRAVQVEPGEQVTLKIKRLNLAERLYRVTGSGIYRDTVLLGRKAPIEEPLLDAGVFGCDSVMAAIYEGKIHWFWGDTTRPQHPIGGNFHVTGATSPLPRDGGLDPDLGVNFDYFVGDEGTIRPMAEMPGEGPTWISALTVLRDDEGRERMYAGYVKIRNRLESYRWGFVVWNDETERFEKVVSFDERPAIFLEPQTHTFLRRAKDGTQYVYFTNPFPLTRVEADPDAFVDPKRYEGFTCLRAGTRPEDQQLDRDRTGRLRYGWKPNTPPLTQKDRAKLIEAGLMEPEEALIALRDVDTGRTVHAHNGSVYWNEYRQRWVLIAVGLNGESSVLGEVWFAEADEPTGPWVYARKIVSHDEYSFYNPKHHPFFDQDEGKTIYFEGTYTHSFSGNPDQTPRYDYNQIMYKLDLSDPRLNLPVAVSRSSASDGSKTFQMRHPQGEVAFFALERPGAETVPVFQDEGALRIGRTGEAEKDEALLHALPAGTEMPPETTVPLYEFVDTETGQRAYSTDPEWPRSGYDRSAEPICLVWKAPTQRPRSDGS